MKREITCFISPHGYGHAARTVALLETLQQQGWNLHVRLVTTVAETFFKQTSLNLDISFS